MRVTVPIVMTDGKLVSSNVAEPSAGEVVYSTATTYTLDAVVISISAHRQYKSLQANNLGHALPTPPESKNDWWIDIGPTNRWAVFDLVRNTQTISGTQLTFSVAPGERVNTVAMLGMEADTISVAASHAGNVVYTHTENLSLREVLDHYMYAYAPFTTRPSMVVFDIPPYSDIVITVTLSRNTGNVKAGSFVCGTYAYIGDTEYEAESDAMNFSTVTRDIYGTAVLVQRRSVPKTNQQLQLPKQRVNNIFAVRKQLNAVPALWTGLDDASDGYFEMLLILGVYKQFKINAKNPSIAKISLELEEI